MAKSWKVQAPDKKQIDELSRSAGISPLLAWLLLNRGIAAPEQVQKFLEPRLEDLLEEMDAQSFAAAASLLAQAISSKTKFAVHGDYDVDGITAAALVVDFFSALGLPIEHYLPHRLEDGYGLSESGIAGLAQKGVNFLLAVDCGISDHAAVQKAKDLGMKVMVIDHHLPPRQLPPADLILDPHLTDQNSSLKDLCSAGLVFFLLLVLRRILREQGFFAKTPEPNLKRSLDLVALGTVADVAPATGLNRVLLAHGLKELARTSRFGLRVLKKRAGCDEREIGYGQVAFLLAPRLNAAGRIDEPEPGFELLLTQDPKQANQLADELERRNSLRQRLEEKIMEDAVRQLESSPDFKSRKSIVVAGQDWHPGVLGIVAQRLREKYFRPSLAISLSGGMGRGSGRSVNGLDLYQALFSCRELLVEFGGHRLAAGLSLKQENLEPLQQAFEKAVIELAEKDAFQPVLLCDAELPLFMVSPELADQLDMLKPFGPGNPEPLLVAKSVLVLDCQLKKEKHLWLLLRERETTLQAMFFRAGIQPLKPGSLIDLAYNIERRTWNNKTELRLIIRDLIQLS
jgi:single-stranded-DNA-specific exonuclease